MESNSKGADDDWAMRYETALGKSRRYLIAGMIIIALSVILIVVWAETYPYELFLLLLIALMGSGIAIGGYSIVLRNRAYDQGPDNEDN